MWRKNAHYSGTQTVVRDNPHRPWYYVCASPDLTVARRAAIAESLANWLNGGGEADWMDGMQRSGDEAVILDETTVICAVGPMFDASPPALDLKTKMDDVSVAERKYLVNCLLQRRPPLMIECPEDRCAWCGMKLFRRVVPCGIRRVHPECLGPARAALTRRARSLQEWGADVDLRCITREEKDHG